MSLDFSYILVVGYLFDTFIVGEYRMDDELITSCGKMKVLDQLLPRLIHDGHKVLIFSQMTKMLDILYDYCFLRNIEVKNLGKLAVFFY